MENEENRDSNATESKKSTNRAPTKCCLPHCKSTELPNFPFPKDTKTRKLWEDATGKFNNKSHFVGYKSVSLRLTIKYKPSLRKTKSLCSL